MDTTRRVVFITGSMGYIGGALIPALHERGHVVRALVRSGSRRKLAAGALAIEGDALVAASFRDAIAPADTFVHLVGTPHPSPAKAKQFSRSRSGLDPSRRGGCRPRQDAAFHLLERGAACAGDGRVHRRAPRRGSASASKRHARNLAAATICLKKR